MKAYLKMVRPFDVIIIILLILLSFLPIVIFSAVQAEESGKDIVAVITQDGKKIRTITLTGHNGDDIFTIHGKGKQYNIIEVKGESIRIKEDNSPDQVGVKMGWKSEAGETIICLPHKLFIDLKTKKPQKTDANDIIIPN